MYGVSHDKMISSNAATMIAYAQCHTGHIPANLSIHLSDLVHVNTAHRSQQLINVRYVTRSALRSYMHADDIFSSVQTFPCFLLLCFNQPQGSYHGCYY